MKVMIVDDYETLSARAADMMIGIVKENPCAVLGLATGTTPLGLYAHMISDHQTNKTDYSRIRTVNLDEYMGLSSAHEQSYAYFMKKNLFDGLGRMKPQSARGTMRSSNSSRAIFSSWAWAATGILPSMNRVRCLAAGLTLSRLPKARSKIMQDCSPIFPRCRAGHIQWEYGRSCRQKRF